MINRPAGEFMGTPFSAQIFISRRTSANNFDQPAVDPFFSTGVGLGAAGMGAGPLDILQLADLNGDGVDEILAVRDITEFQQNWWTFGQFTQAAPLFFPQPDIVAPGTNAANRTSGVDIADFPITRRDFDGDGNADTANVLDARVFNSANDFFSWTIQGSSDQVLPQFGPFLGAGTGNQFFGVASRDIPLVGDFDGDGISDRAVAIDATGFEVDARLIHIDLSPSAGNLGDGGSDSGNGNVIGFAADEVLAADIDGDGFDDLVTLRPDLANDTWSVEGYINQQNAVIGGTENVFVKDDAYTTSIGVLSLGDTIAFGTFGLIEPEAPGGDYNGDGFISAADYTVWRDGGVPDSTQTGYDAWVSGFGQSESLSPAIVAPVPEPASLGLLLAFGAIRPLARRR